MADEGKKILVRDVPEELHKRIKHILIDADKTLNDWMLEIMKKEVELIERKKK